MIPRTVENRRFTFQEILNPMRQILQPLLTIQGRFNSFCDGAGGNPPQVVAGTYLSKLIREETSAPHDAQELLDGLNAISIPAKYVGTLFGIKACLKKAVSSAYVTCDQCGEAKFFHHKNAITHKFRREVEEE